MATYAVGGGGPVSWAGAKKQPAATFVGIIMFDFWWDRGTCALE
jgi:hypothetical protein